MLPIIIKEFKEYRTLLWMRNLILQLLSNQGALSSITVEVRIVSACDGILRFQLMQ